jgi:hypothetical protein
MVFPEFQGRGLAKHATRAQLERARDEGRWELVHAFPATTNGPSNGICRSLGFRLVGEQDTTFAGRVLRTNHWLIDPSFSERVGEVHFLCGDRVAGPRRTAVGGRAGRAPQQGDLPLL